MAFFVADTVNLVTIPHSHFLRHRARLNSQLSFLAPRCGSVSVLHSIPPNMYVDADLANRYTTTTAKWKLVAEDSKCESGNGEMCHIA